MKVALLALLLTLIVGGGLLSSGVASPDTPTDQISPEILDAKVFLSRAGMNVSLEVGNNGDTAIRLRKGGLNHHIAVSESEQTITVTLDDGAFICGGYTLTFSDPDLNIVMLGKSQYTELKLLAQGFGGNFGSTIPEVLDAIANDYSVTVKLLFENTSTGHSYWTGTTEYKDAIISANID